MLTTNLSVFRKFAKVVILGFVVKALIVGAIYVAMSSAPRFAAILA